MALQPIFKRGYIEYLKTHVEPSLYMGDSLDYDRADLTFTGDEPPIRHFENRFLTTTRCCCNATT